MALPDCNRRGRLSGHRVTTCGYSGKQRNADVGQRAWAPPSEQET